MMVLQKGVIPAKTGVEGTQVSRPITVSGNPGNDAKYYQVRAVRMAIEETKR